MMPTEETEKALVDRLARSHGDSSQALFELACFYDRVGRPKAGLAQIEKLLETSTDRESKAKYSIMAGQFLQQVQDFGAATPFYAEALALSPADVQTRYSANNNYGDCLNRLGRFRDAEIYCRQAVELDATRFDAHKNLGASLEGQGRFAEAARSYILATRADAGDARAFEKLMRLAASHPEIEDEIPDIVTQVSRCREMVRSAARMHDLEAKRTALEP